MMLNFETAILFPFLKDEDEDVEMDSIIIPGFDVDEGNDEESGDDDDNGGGVFIEDFVAHGA